MMVFVRPNAMLYQEAEVGELFQRPYFIGSSGLAVEIYVPRPRFSASQSHALRATYGYLGRNTRRTLQGFLML